MQEPVKPDGRKIYVRCNVLEAARWRIGFIFDRFERVVVSVSGGKDSHVLFELAYAEARRRERDLHVFFLDQEAEYQSTIDVVASIMARPGVVPLWYQVPLRMTNATSYEDEWFTAWHEGQEWMRDKHPIAIHEAPAAPGRFYEFMEWQEARMGEGTAFLVGLRSEESLNRFGAVTRNPAIPGVPWSSKGAGGAVRLYPLYDWSFEDIWTYLGKLKIRYNRVYDHLYVKNVGINEFRVSFLLHERSFKCMTTLQEFEPETYDRLVRRIKGAHVAAIYAKEPTIFGAGKLPASFPDWRSYRDFLLAQAPAHRREAFARRFAEQEERDAIYKQQVRQLLINDWENNVPVVPVPERDDPRKKWMEIL